VERTNQTLKQRLGKYINPEGDDWDQHLEEIAYSIRTQTQKSTKFTPFYLMYGRHPNTYHYNPDDHIDDEEILQEPEITHEQLASYVEERISQQKETHSQVLPLFFIVNYLFCLLLWYLYI
jgi:hypothetical protein